jgi:hypothetical protein
MSSFIPKKHSILKIQDSLFHNPSTHSLIFVLERYEDGLCKRQNCETPCNRNVSPLESDDPITIVYIMSGKDKGTTKCWSSYAFNHVEKVTTIFEIDQDEV